MFQSQLPGRSARAVPEAGSAAQPARKAGYCNRKSNNICICGFPCPLQPENPSKPHLQAPSTQRGGVSICSAVFALWMRLAAFWRFGLKRSVVISRPNGTLPV